MKMARCRYCNRRKPMRRLGYRHDMCRIQYRVACEAEFAEVLHRFSKRVMGSHDPVNRHMEREKLGAIYQHARSGR